MKRYLTLSLTVLLFCLLISCGEKQKQEEARIIEYPMVLAEWDNLVSAMEKFPSDEVVGPVLTAEEAVEKAIEIWIARYGEADYPPYRVFFDEAEDIWYIRGSLQNEEMDGGTGEILIERSTGRVLAVWHSK